LIPAYATPKTLVQLGKEERCNNANYNPEYTSFKELGFPVKEVRDKVRAARSWCSQILEVERSAFPTTSLDSAETTIAQCLATQCSKYKQAQVDLDTIKLLGWWQLDTMLSYLHIQSHPVRNQFALAMLEHNSFIVLPHCTA
jgi:hypothetical protein